LANLASSDDTSSGSLPENTEFRKTLNHSAQNNSSSELTCTYGPETFSLEKTVTNLVVYGLGQRPSKVEVSRSLQGKQTSAALPSINLANAWSAFGHGLDCSFIGCASGIYRVVVSYSPALSSCPTKLSLEVQVPPE
jgi:hypothetical protein